MFARSERFDEAIRNGGNRVFRGQVTIGVDDFSLAIIEPDVPILSGSVDVNAAAQRRRTLSNCQIPDIDRVWSRLDRANPLAPFSSEFRPYVGFAYDDGTEELLPLGVFRLEESTSIDRGIITISGFDRSLVVAAAGFETPHVITAGTAPEDAVLTIVERSFPGVSLTADVAYSGFTLPLTVLQEGSQGGGDPWKSCTDLLANVGAECFFGATGQLVIRPIPDATIGLPIWVHEPGEDSIILSALDRVSARDVRNIAIVIGEGPGITTPVRATASVTDTQSPIYPAAAPGFGRRPIFIKSAQISTTIQATTVANAYIREQAGAAERTTFTAVPHPAHEGGDVVRVKVDEMGLDILGVLEQFGIDLTLSTPTTYQTKGRRSL